MENRKINSMADLRLEIIRLQIEVDEREALIRHDLNEVAEQVKAPFHFMKKLAGWFGGGTTDQAASADWLTSVLQLGFPWIVNNLFFKRSGIFTKGLIALLSQKAISGINLEKFTHWVEQLNQWITKQGKKKSDAEDYGIPPDSETF